MHDQEEAVINIVMLVKDRPRLTLQTLTSLRENTLGEWSLVLVDDASKPETRDMCVMFARAEQKRVALLRNETSSGVTGLVRNLGVYWAEKYFSRGEWLYLSDNDVFFTDGWDRTLKKASDLAPQFALIGGQNHPYHQACWPIDGIREYQDLAGTSWLMRWAAWDRYGPLVPAQPGVCQGEDTVFCKAIRLDGYKIGAVWPEVVYDCGITQTGGTPSPGADLKPRHKGVLYV
jgi:glycosyltransferase involved in cell wall biosynthesis